VKKIFGVLTLILLASLRTSAQTQQPIRVNCGGSAYTDSKGQAWTADYGFNSGGGTYSTVSSISGTSDQKLFQTEHYGDTLIYSFPVANGNYTVNLLFAEIYYNRTGSRVMNVKVQGIPAFSNLDIYASAGANTALTKSTAASVTNGTLTIELDNVIGGAKVSAIEILPIASGAPLTLNFKYPDGTPVSGSLAYTISSSLISFQGSTPLTNGQAQCLLFANPSAMGISAQFQVSLSLTDTAGHQLWQINLGMNPATVNLGAIQNSSLNVTVQKL